MTITAKKTQINSATKDHTTSTGSPKTDNSLEIKSMPPDPLTRKANFNHWKKRELWLLEEAIFLINNVEPCEAKHIYTEGDGVSKKLWEMFKLAETAIVVGKLKSEAGYDGYSQNYSDDILKYVFIPRNFVTWAATVVAIPDELKDLIGPEEFLPADDQALLADIKAYLDPDNPYYAEEGAIGFLVWRDLFRNKEYLENKSQKSNPKFKSDIRKMLEKKFGSGQRKQMIDRIAIAQNPDKKGGAQSLD